MSRSAVIAVLLALAVEAEAQEPDRGARPSQIPAELRETLPGGSRAGEARELPGAVVDLLPKPTRITVRVRREAATERER
jgi:hypothetical protein